MTITTLLIANRGEIAIRVARAAADLGIRTVALHSEDDAAALHLRFADQVVALPGRGVAAYLSIPALIAAARGSGADALHPGYGLLSESAELAEACAAAGLRFAGPDPATLRRLGDKAAARALAADLGVPLLPGTQAETSLAAADEFLRGLGPQGVMMLKALAGGGGRGMRVVRAGDDLPALYAACSAEALKAFGQGGLYVERMVEAARHIEVQILGDGQGGLIALGERDCTLQRRHQKLIEIAPAPGLPAALRDRLTADALRMAGACNYLGLGTFEFLVAADYAGDYWFMEANPRIQVEHTITEQVTGVDLVQAQLQVVAGQSLSALGLAVAPQSRGMAIQLRVNAESQQADGSVRPASGRITRYELPVGPGLRVDGSGHSGFQPNPGFDSLLAKIIVSVPQQGPAGYDLLLRRARRAIDETSIEGVETNLGLLHALLAIGELAQDRVTTRFVETRLDGLIADAVAWQAARPAAVTAADVAAAGRTMTPPGTRAEPAHLAAAVAEFRVALDETVQRGQVLAVLEAMKMEHEIRASGAGVVRGFAVAPGAVVAAGDPLLFVEPGADTDEAVAEEAQIDLDHLPDLLGQELARRAQRMDAARPEAIAQRHARGQRSLRENIDDLCDPGSFVEYGGLAIASQRRRRPLEELTAMSPGDGMVAGTATINGADGRAMVIGYDYTVFAGTQGWANHRKLGRMLQIAEQNPMPLVLFAEGGGGRPGDTDQMRSTGMDTRNFAWLARLSGRAPIVGIAAGRCFAGNAAVLGLSDVVIATRSASIGMGGPAMIEGGGLGVFRAEEVGPAPLLAEAGVVDLLAGDEAEAVALARRYLGYFQAPPADWSCADQRILRHVLPENRRLTYDMRAVIEALCDTGSVLELRRAAGAGMVTCLARIEGRAIGVVANDNRHLSGAIDVPGANKVARFLKLCDAFGLPVVSLCDTPGFMVGPESERQGAVRVFSRMFLAGANIRVPLITVVLRKGYGLGAMGMAGGSLHEPMLTIAWPTAEFGGMGLEGAVRLGYRNELAAIADPAARKARYEELVAKAYADGRPHIAAGFVEIDDVVDPAETRGLIAATFAGWRGLGGSRPGYIDCW